MDPEEANLNMDGPNRGDRPPTNEPNRGGRMVLEVLIKNPDMEKPCTRRLTIIEGCRVQNLGWRIHLNGPNGTILVDRYSLYMDGSELQGKEVDGP